MEIAQSDITTIRVKSEKGDKVSDIVHLFLCHLSIVQIIYLWFSLYYHHSIKFIL